MALNFGIGNRSIAFAPTSAFPLNANSYFESYDLALAAARTAKPAGDTTTKYYFGQEIVVAEMIDNVPQSAKLYLIVPETDEDGKIIGNLQEVGTGAASTPTEGDNASIELNEGVLSVKDFGKRYYKYIAETEEEEAHYELVEVDETNKWSAGLEPRIAADGTIGWYEPNPTTVEGVQNQVIAVQQAVQNLQNNTYTKTEIDNLVASVFSFKGSKESLEELEALTDSAIGDVWQVGNQEYVYTENGWEPLGATVDLSGYATKKEVEDQVKAVDDKVTALDERLDAVEEDIGAPATDDADATGIFADLEALHDSLESLEAVIGEPASDGVDATGIYKDLEEMISNALAAVPNEAVLGITVGLEGHTLEMNESGIVNLPIFGEAGSTYGMVPVYSGDADETYMFLNANGAWIDAFGDMGLNDAGNKATVVEYVRKAIEDAALVWLPIAE